MTPSPAVSVLLTAFNRERYIGSAIESVLAQTFTDFELIVVDDGSTDRTVDLAKAYLHDPRVRLVQNERNIGQFRNRNYAASLARGEYLKYHDSDDLMYPHCLSVLVDLLSAAPSAAFAISPHRAWSGGPTPMLLTPRQAYEREFFGMGMTNFGPAAALFRRDAFEALGGFPDEGPHSDELFWLKACARVNTLLAYADLFWYRVHAEQHLRGAGAAYDGAVIQSRWVEALNAPDCPLPAADRERAKTSLAGRILRSVFRDLRGGHLHLAWFRLRHAGFSVTEWLRYASRPSTVSDAGSPRTPDGDIVIPAAIRRPPDAAGGKP
jgi:glycosyltransferase involved in cell wall biosynthesis